MNEKELIFWVWRLLTEGDMPEYVRNEYGKTVKTGFRAEPNGDGVRITHKIPDEDLMNPDRRSSDDRWLEKYRSCAVYTYVLERAGWSVEMRITPGNEVIVLARPKDGGE